MNETRSTPSARGSPAGRASPACPRRVGSAAPPGRCPGLRQRRGRRRRYGRDPASLSPLGSRVLRRRAGHLGRPYRLPSLGLDLLGVHWLEHVLSGAVELDPTVEGLDVQRLEGGSYLVWLEAVRVLDRLFESDAAGGGVRDDVVGLQLGVEH